MKKAVTIVAAGLAGLLGFSTIAVAEVLPERETWSFGARDLTAVDRDPDTTEYNWGTVVYDENDQRVIDAALFADTFTYELTDGEYKAVKKALQTKDDIDLTVHEVLPLVFDGYKGGELDVEFEWPTDYSLIETNGTVAVYIAIEGQGTYIVKGYVTKEGTIRFHIDADCAAAIANGKAYVAIISAA
jgi:hypothetical protein